MARQALAVTLLPWTILLTGWSVGLHLNQTQWLSGVISQVCWEHHTTLVTLHTCWHQAVTMRVAGSLREYDLMQSWSLDVGQSSEISYEVFVVDLDCPGSAGLMFQVSHLRKFTLRYSWLLFSFSLSNVTKRVSVSDILSLYPWMNSLDIFPDSKVILATNEDSELISLYRVGKDSIIQLRDLKAVRSDLQRTKLTSSTVLFQPKEFRGFYSGHKPHIDTFPKLHYPVVVNLADQLNFNLELWTVNDYGWEQNGSFTGLMGQLQKREVDFAATGFFMRPDRIRVVDFTAETYHIRTSILFRQPSLSSVSNIFLLPFSSQVWVCCLAYCVIVIFVFCFGMVAYEHNGISHLMPQNVGFMDVVTLVLGSVCQQGSHLVPEKLSGRITLFCLSLTSLFFFTSYAANIVALLQSPSSALVTLTDLVNSPLAVGIQDLEYNRIYFKESIDPATRLLYEKKVKPRGTMSYFKPEDGIRKVRSELFAFNVEINLGYKMISETYLDTEKCALSEIQLFPMPMLSLPLTKRSGYRDLFTQKVRWQRETGILHRIGKMWLPQKPKCEDVRGGTGFVSVGYKEILPALNVLCFGILLSFILLLFELLCYHRKKLLLVRKMD